MPIALTSLKPNDVVYDARTVKEGNTMMRRLSAWKVHIKDVNLEFRSVTASWNGNPPKKYYARNGKLPWRRTDPSKRLAESA